MIVVFDTNIWRSELYLQSPASVAVRFFLRQAKAKVALPEVIKLEVERHLADDIRKIRQRMIDDHRRLLGYFGKLKEMILPDDADLARLSEKLFNELGVEIVEVPFSLASARNSFLKTINKEPPSDQDQQFKDGVIWADCVTLLELDDVWLISSDSAFYNARKIEAGLAEPLNAEISSCKHKLFLKPNLKDLLAEIRTDTKIDEATITKAALNERQSEITRMLTSHGFSLGKMSKFQRTVFLTEQPNNMLVNFRIEFECESKNDVNSEDYNALLTLTGDTIYNVESLKLSNFKDYSPVLQYQDTDGSIKELKGATIHLGTVHFGHREVEHTIRYRLDE